MSVWGIGEHQAMASENHDTSYTPKGTKVLAVFAVLGVLGCPVVFPFILALVSGTNLLQRQQPGETAESLAVGKRRHALILMLSLFVLYFHLWLLNIFGSVPAVAMYAVSALMMAIGMGVSIWAYLRRTHFGIWLAGLGMASVVIGILLILKTGEIVASRSLHP
jgi:hypothetical protein